MEGLLKKRCVSECLLFVCPDEILVLIVSKLGGKDRLHLLCTCTDMHDIILAVCPPWSQDGTGLRWAVCKGYTKYYEQWAKEAGPERWSPDARLLESAFSGPARNDWSFMLSLLEDERVDPTPVLCDQGYYKEKNELELFRLVVQRGRSTRLDCGAILKSLAAYTNGPRCWFALAQLYSELQLRTPADPVIACTAASRVGDWSTVLHLMRKHQHDDAFTFDKALKLAVLQANGQVVQSLLEMDGLHWPNSLLALVERPDIARMLLVRLDPAANDSEALRSAAADERISIVKLLLRDGRADPREAFLEAWTMCPCPSPKMVELFLSDPRVDPSIHESKALRLTLRRRKTRRTHAERVALMLLRDGRCDPSVRDNIAIRNAARLGYAKVVHLLLWDPRVDSKARGNEALFNATKHGHEQIIEMLLFKK
jgi:hypothetical protein